MQHSNPIGQHSSAALTLLDLLEKLHANDNVCDGIECGALLSIPKFRGIGKMLGRGFEIPRNPCFEFNTDF